MKLDSHCLRILLAGSLTLGVAACGGEDGDNGARGPQGEQGPEGPAGPTGPEGPAGEDATASTIRLQQIGRYESNIFDEGAAEIVAHDPTTQRLYVVNADAASVDALDIADPTNPTLVDTIDATNHGAGANSVDVHNGTIAVAVEAATATDNGVVAFYDASLTHLGNVAVGALPDMVTFTHDGSRVLVANEGEPNSDYSVDPEGSVSIIDVSGGVAGATATTVGFTAFNSGGSRAAELPAGVRVFGNCDATVAGVAGYNDADPAELTLDDASGFTAGRWFTLASGEDPIPYRIASVAGNTLTLNSDFDGDTDLADLGPATLHDGNCSVAQDLEPEYIAVAPDDSAATVSLQENNAVAVIDLEAESVARIVALGTKDHDLPGFGLDASNDDDAIRIRNHPVQGMYMPDAIAAFEYKSETYLITANEGDAREYDAYVEEVKFEDVDFDAAAGIDEAPFDDDTRLGDLATSLANDTDGDGDLDVAHSFGARSFSVWNGQGQLVWDSGDAFEAITAQRFGHAFNASNDANDFDDRSDAKGPEPEAVTTAVIEGRTYGFIGLERIGGIMVYELTNPEAPVFVQYLNNRDFNYNIEDDIDDGTDPAGAAGDLGPEGMRFIAAADSPTGTPLLAVGNEVSGTTTLYEISVVDAGD